MSLVIQVIEQRLVEGLFRIQIERDASLAVPHETALEKHRATLAMSGRGEVRAYVRGWSQPAETEVSQLQDRFFPEPLVPAPALLTSQCGRVFICVFGRENFARADGIDFPGDLLVALGELHGETLHSKTNDLGGAQID